MTSEDRYNTKMFSAGFEPTWWETDFDSVVVTSQLRLLRGTTEETIHESMSKGAAMEKSFRSAGFEPAQAKRDRFGFCCSSTTWLRPVKMHIRRNHLRDEARTTLTQASQEIVHERIFRPCSEREKNCSSASFELAPSQSKRNRFWICCHLAKTN
jgi:hypothetical protein